MHTLIQQRYVLVESFPKGDADFVGRWLFAAYKANEIWREAVRDAQFYAQVQRIEIAEEFHFTFSALDYLSKLDNKTVTLTFAVDDCDLGEPFAVMAPLGFFVSTGDRYQMAVPDTLTRERVKGAFLNFAATQDGDYLHPEKLVGTISFAEAKEWEKRLHSIGEAVRCADRALLLGDHDKITLQHGRAWLPTGEY